MDSTLKRIQEKCDNAIKLLVITIPRKKRTNKPEEYIRPLKVVGKSQGKTRFGMSWS